MTDNIPIAYTDAGGNSRPLAAQQNGPLYSFESVPTIDGVPVRAATPMPVTDAAAETSLAAIAVSDAASATAAGTPTDAAYAGGASGSFIAVLKGIFGFYGVQGTGATFNPPTGGLGLLGYLSGIFKAVTGTLTATISAGSALIGSVITIPTNASGSFSSATVTNAAGQILAANVAKKVLRIYNAGTGTVWINFGGTAAPNTAGSVPITPLGAYVADPQFIPSDAVSAVSTVASNPVTICAA